MKERLCGNTENKKPLKSPKQRVSPEFSYQFKEITMQSEVLCNVLYEDLLSRAKIFTRTLLLSEFDTYQGINVSADIPRCCSKPVINLKRPAVLRIYYGLSEYSYSSPYVVRPTYGPTRFFSSVGIDPKQFRTKPFTNELSVISHYLKNMVSTYEVTGYENTFKQDFNHCTVLVYKSDGDNKANSTLSFHCDSTYDVKGNFKTTGNTQLEKSPVLVMTLGDSRELNFRLRVVLGNKWKITNINLPSITLPHNSLFILHYRDEVPTEREDSRCLSQITHGGIKVQGEKTLSLALCFRAVTKKRSYDPTSNRLIYDKDDLSTDSYHQTAAKTLDDFKKNELSSYQSRFHTFVKSKFDEWKWFNGSS